MYYTWVVCDRKFLEESTRDLITLVVPVQEKWKAKGEWEGLWTDFLHFDF